METLKLRTGPGIAKVAGLAFCIGGAAVLAFYQGPHQLFCLHRFFRHHNGQAFYGHAHSGKAWMKGCFLLLVSNVFWGSWLVLQARVLKSYPSKLLFTTLLCFLSSIQSFAIAIALAREPLQWKLGWDVSLLTVAYCGIVVTGVAFYLQAWVIEKKGPVFLAMSNPFSLIFTMFCSTIFLCEIIHLGSIFGGLLLVGGLYSVLLAKRKEEKMNGKSDVTAEAKEECSSELKAEAKEECSSELKQVTPVERRGPVLV